MGMPPSRKPGEARVAQLVARPVHQTSAGPRVGEHLVEPFRRERSPAGGSLQRHEQPVRLRVRWPFQVEIAGHRREERLRHRHQPLVAALAVGDEHPPLTEAEVFEAQAEHLAATQPTQQHRLHDRPVPLGVQRVEQRLHLGRRQDPRQSSHPAHQRHNTPSAAMTALARRQPPRHRIHPDIAPGDEIAVEARHRGEAPLDRRRRQPRTPVGDPHHVLRARRGPCCTATNSNTSRGVTSTGSLVTIEKKTVRSCAYARTVFGRTRPCVNSKNSSTKSWPTRHDRTPSARVTH